MKKLTLSIIFKPEDEANYPSIKEWQSCFLTSLDEIVNNPLVLEVCFYDS